MGLCILAGGSMTKAYAAITAFTLAWTHSVEKIEWREDWRITGDRLLLVAARIHGDGAGMEPPADAEFDGSGWRWRPNVEPISELILRRSGVTSDWRLCVDGDCRDLGAVVGSDADPVRLVACTAAPSLAPAPVYNGPGFSEPEDKIRAR